MCELTFIVAHPVKARAANAAIANVTGRGLMIASDAQALCESDAADAPSRRWRFDDPQEAPRIIRDLRAKFSAGAP
jgi:hypothetical protein